MKALVTGGCGFLGSHVAEAFLREGFEVVAYDNLTKHELERTGYATEAARAHLRERLEGLGVTVQVADVRDASALLDAASGCDILAHTAAQPAMTIGWEQPGLDFETNLAGTRNVLEAARRHGLPVAACSTVHVYGPGLNDDLHETPTRCARRPPMVREDEPLLRTGANGRLTPLHASKAGAEHYVRVYADQYGVRAASFRLTGLYGPRQFGGEDHGWVANFAIRALLGRPLTIFGDGRQTRDVLYADDAAAAFVAWQRQPQAGAFNVCGGPERELSLLECIDLLATLLGTRPQVAFEPARPGDLRWFCGDSARARAAFGWEPRVLPAEGVRRLLGWAAEHRALFAGSEPGA
ncbi:MAG TPA: NAD-dependent epimerase/dehydratase family protein [Planctomycetota bacterium]